MIATVLALAMTSAPTNVERFAIVVGHNQSADADNATLAYADDDAFRTYELLRAVMPRSHIALFATPDDATRRLFPDLVERAGRPTLGAIEAGVRQLKRRATAARKRGAVVEVYFFYSGHGNVRRGQGFLEVADGRIGPDELSTMIVAPFGDARVHLVIDSCNSFYLLNARGPGGRRYRITTPATRKFFAKHPNVGVFLSTSAANEVFEWSELQSGVFSHELRSGLLGPADANGDGRVSYRELELFVLVANGAIENERFRPRVFVRPPVGANDAELLPVREDQRVQIEQPGRYILQDDRGLRVADLHSVGGPVIVGLPGARRYFLRKIDRQGPRPRVTEIDIPTSTGTIIIAQVDTPARMNARGAEALVFKRLFERPYPPADPTAGWIERRDVPVAPAEWVHGPVAAVGVQSGHLADVSVVPTLLLGYRAALDRFAFDAAVELGLTGVVGPGDNRYRFRRIGIRAGPRYDVPFGAWAFSTGPLVGVAWEHQTPELGAAEGDASSVLWAWRAGLMVLPAEALQLGVEFHMGGRIVPIADEVRHRWVGGVALVAYLMP